MQAMLSRIVPHWRLSLALLLLAAQALLLGLGLFDARVSPGYRALFIDHTMMTSPYESHSFVWPGPAVVPEMAVPSHV
jgi:hypothetical protein